MPMRRVRRLPAACDADAAQNSATTSPVHASQQRAAACDLRQCWEGPCPSRARRLSPDVRRIASSGRTPSLSRGAAEPGRLKLCPTSPFRGGCATEWIADESLSAVHGAWRWGLRAPSWTASGGAYAPPGTSARSDFVTTSVSSRRTATFHLKVYLPRCPKRGVKGCPNVPLFG